MDEQARFRTALAALGAGAEKRGRKLTREEVQAFFQEMGLNEEQRALVGAYLASRGIRAEGMELPEVPRQEPVWTEEEQIFLKQYQKDMRTVARQPEEALPALADLAADGDGPAKRCLTEHCMVQEGSLGLMIGVDTLGLREEETSWEDHVEQEIRRAIQGALDEQAGSEDTGCRIAEKLNRLADSITQLTEDLGRQVTPEELSLYLDIPLEELDDLLRIAGENIEMAERK